MRAFSWLRGRVSSAGPCPSSGRPRATGRPAPRRRPRLEALEDRAVPAGGVLDPTFGSGGVVDSSLAASTRAFAVATYPREGTANDGKIVAAGFAVGPGRNSYQFALVRYNLDGSLDKSFGGKGEVTGPTASGAGAFDVVVQPDGKVVAAGESNGDFALVRYNPDGTLDSKFGSRGVARTGITSKSFDRVYAIALQADGKIVAVGGTNPANSSSREVAVARYNADGTLDTTFGDSIGGDPALGKTGLAVDHIPTSPLEGGGTQGFGLAIDPGTGQIVVAAANPTRLPQGYDAMVIRYKNDGTSDGTLDTSFAGNGYETFDGNVLPSLVFTGGLAIQPGDHRIVVAGRVSSGGPVTGLARLNPDGTLDGMLVSTTTRDIGEVDAVRLQPDGRIVVGETGSVTFGTGNTLTVARYNSDLTPDTSFGTGGVAGVPNVANPPDQQLTDMAFEPDGRVVVTGWSTSVNGHVILARFLATGPRIGSFTADPSPATAGSPVALTANITDGNPNGTVTQVAFYYFDSGGVKQLLGYGDQTSPGVWKFTFTVNLPPGSYALFAQGVDTFGALGDPVSLVLTVQ